LQITFVRVNSPYPQTNKIQVKIDAKQANFKTNMSLFDVIRWPVTDIFNQEELSKLPSGIYDPWLELCIKDADYPERYINPSPGYTAMGIVQRVASFKSYMSALISHTKHFDNPTAATKEEILILEDVKAEYTALLRKMIKEYDV